MIGATEAFLGSTSHFGEYPKKKKIFLKSGRKNLKRSKARNVGWRFFYFDGAERI